MTNIRSKKTGQSAVTAEVRKETSSLRTSGKLLREDSDDAEEKKVNLPLVLGILLFLTQVVFKASKNTVGRLLSVSSRKAPSSSQHKLVGNKFIRLQGLLFAKR